MIRILDYLRGVGQQTVTAPPFPALDEYFRGMPYVTQSPCEGSSCNACVDVCPTDVIRINHGSDGAKLSLDLGGCIGCGLCIESCPSGTIVENKSPELSVRNRQDLILTNDVKLGTISSATQKDNKANPFRDSLHVRVVSTGCSACDAEINASGNAVFDIERFGVHIVASPRYADALVVTGPVGKGMQNALRRCYEAMAEPRVVVAMGTCAISGGVHKGGYTQANGVDKILPTNVYIPGCPPHPWTFIHGVLLAMGRVDEGKPDLSSTAIQKQAKP